MARLSMAKIRKCLYPYPVYEATFADNSTLRMSFWSPAKKGVPDVARGRRVALATSYARGFEWQPSQFGALPVRGGPVNRVFCGGRVLWNGHVYDDPLETAAVVKMAPAKRVTAKMLREVLAGVLDGDGEAITEARRLLAA